MNEVHVMKTGAIAVAALLSLTSLAHADEPENFIKYRQSMMTAIGGHNGSASQILRGKVAPPGHLAIHANALRELTADLAALFPEGSDFGETKAKAEIWNDWAGFEKAAGDAKAATAAFAEAVAGGDAGNIEAAFKQIGETCKGCHKSYREKDD